MAASKRELKALITVAGKMDPSLQVAMTKAIKSTQGLQKQTGLLGLMGKNVTSGITAKLPNLLGGQDSYNRIKGIGTSIVGLGQKNEYTKASLASLGNMGTKTFKLLGSGAKVAAIGMGGLATAGLGAVAMVAKTGLGVASDLTEIGNVIDVTYGKDAKAIDSWSKSLLNSYGLSELSAKKYTSTMGAMLNSSDVANKDMVTISKGITTLTGDMASFYNMKPDEMFEKLQAGISGESEPLKELGVNMSVASLEAYALSSGIEKSYQSMTEAEKIGLRYEYIVKATADAQGDFTRTSGSMANQQKLLKENFIQLAGNVMTTAMPAMTAITTGLNGFMASADSEVLGGFVNQIAQLAMALLPVAMQLLPVIMSAVTAILPPLIKICNLILPPLTKFLTLVVKVLGAGLEGLAMFIGGVADLFTDDGQKTNVKAYARGGFANSPSIFGEAGLEAAIPIKKNNPRSIMLLNRTAQMLGVGNTLGTLKRESIAPLKGVTNRTTGITLHYAPVIHGGDSQTGGLLKKNLAELKEMLLDVEIRQRRMAF